MKGADTVRAARVADGDDIGEEQDLVDRFTSETFRDLVGETFTLTPTVTDDAPFTAELIRCVETPYGDPDQWRADIARVPFSLTFASRDVGVVPQQICRVEHPELGEFDLFLVPIGPDREHGGMRYEAVFS